MNPELTHSMEGLWDACEKSITYCGWMQTRNTKNFIDSFKKEIQELETEIDKGDKENVQEEAGDVLYVTLTLLLLAQKEHHFNLPQLMDNVVEKLRRRKPFIFENRMVSKEEAEKLWQEAKQKEKLMINRSKSENEH